MKTTFIIILINLAIVCCDLPEAISVYGRKSCSDYLIGKKTAYSTEFCRSLYYSTSDYFRCCYYHAKYEGNTYRGCLPITLSQYANASELEPNDLEGLNNSFTDFSIHCNSKYLTIAASFVAFVFALF